MAKKSKIAKAKKQMAMIEKYADKRQELKAAGDFVIRRMVVQEGICESPVLSLENLPIKG